MVRNSYAYFIVLALLMTSGTATASDREREKRWADQIVDGLIDGEAQWLKAQGHEFLGIYTEGANSDEIKGNVILLHGTGAHPDWPQVISPLRVGLAELGWNTLSLQMPLLSSEAKISEFGVLFDEVEPRITAGIEFLKGQGSQHFIIIGHSLGATMASYYLVQHKGSAVEAFVGIGMPSGNADSRMDNASSLAQIKIPVLDIYGSADSEDILKYSEDILKSPPARAAAAKKAGNEAYTQIRVEGADHFFNNKETELLKIVSDWLETQN
jgi:pimeloyl-ACP methyl ester carboxylesterase